MIEEQSSLGALEHLAIVAQGSNSQPESIARLTQAFELFSKETQRLESAYSALKHEYQMLNCQLDDTNKRLHQKIQELDGTTRYLDSILCHMGQGLIFVSTEGLISTYNPVAEEILGQAAETVLQRPFWDFFEDDVFGFSLQTALNGSSPTDLCAISVNGRELELTSSFVADSSSLSQGIIILIRDVTELQRWKMLAARNDRLQELGEMAASVAHEIRNPLGGIRGFSSLLVRDLSQQPKLRVMAQQITDGAESINRLITNTLNYARPVHLRLVSTDLVELLRDVMDLILMDRRWAKHCPIELTLPTSPVYHSIDRDLFKNALCNLLINALEASPPGKAILLRLTSLPKLSSIEIQDFGDGITKENIEKIFSPFFTTKHCGNGFGLSEAHKTIQAHGGSIEVSSEQGQGTTMTLRLPNAST